MRYKQGNNSPSYESLFDQEKNIYPSKKVGRIHRFNMLMIQLNLHNNQRNISIVHYLSYSKFVEVR